MKFNILQNAYMFHSVCDNSMSLGGQISVSIEMGKRALDRWWVQWSLVDSIEKDAMREVAKSQSITLPNVIFGQIKSEDFARKCQAFILSQQTSAMVSMCVNCFIEAGICILLWL